MLLKKTQHLNFSHMQSFLARETFCTCAASSSSPVGNPVDAEDVPILSDDLVLLTGVAIIGDDFTLPREKTALAKHLL